MEKTRLTLFTLGFGVLILVVVLLFARGTGRRANHIELPVDGGEALGSDGAVSDEDSALDLVEITPDTVQQVIAVMDRPTTYARTVTVTTFWEDASASTATQVAVQDELTRLDTTYSDGTVRHLLSDDTTTYIWYDDEEDWISFPNGSFSQDQEQRIPTYEDILDLPAEEIAAAVYDDYQDVYCICVMTTADEAGYDTAYWISTESGLLVAAVTRLNAETIYQMEAFTQESAPEISRFLLPDGTSLISQPITPG